MITVRTYGTNIYQKGRSLELKILNHNIFDNQILTLLTLFSSLTQSFNTLPLRKRTVKTKTMSENDSIVVPEPAVETVVFSLTPATAHGGVLDYATAAGRKLYANATAKLEEDQFDCVADDLYSFLKALKDRAREYGWDEHGIGILSIPDDPENPQEFKSLIDSHGEIDLQTIERFEESYLSGQSRSAQDAAQLYRCLMASISKEGKKKILVWEDQYTIDGYGSGNLLLKVIVRESHLDTNATSASIRTKLTDLDRYLPSIGHDILKFNTYVKLLVDGLKSRGETTQDLLVNLFKGYMACSDSEFVSYMKRKLDYFEEGNSMEPDNLMKNAAEKYKTLLQKGLWNAPDANEEKILALRAEINKLKKSGQKGGKGGTRKAKGTTRKEKPSWFNSRPRDADLHKPKKWDGKTWFYCHPDTGGKCDGKYRIHHPSDCKGKAYRFKENAEKEKPKDGTARNKRRGEKSTENANKKRALKLKKSLEAATTNITEESDYDSDSESE